MSQKPSFKSLSIIALVMVLFGSTALYSHAQDADLSLAAEYDLGFDCPVSATLAPDQTVIWVLMDSCSGRNFRLRGFDVADGTPINDETNDFADALTPLEDGYVDWFVNPLAFTPDGDLSIRYYAEETYDSLTLLVSLENGEATLQTNDSLNALFRQFTDYPETTVYNHDHTLGAVIGETSLHLIDLQTETELMALEVEDFNIFPSFSPDGTRLYAAILDDFGDVENFASTVYVYSLPDGELLTSFSVPTPFLYPAPNGQYAALQVGDSELSVLNLETGVSSPAVRFSEDPKPITECLNTGNSMTDFDYRSSGNLPLVGLAWLPDNSGFMTLHSYQGDGVFGGTPCFFDYSRLRLYQFAGE